MKLISIFPFALLVTKNLAARSARQFQSFTRVPDSPVTFTQKYGENCGKYATSNKRIVNGEAIHISRTPWQVYLSRKQHDGAEFCGGSIISPRWVVSAGHCKTNSKVYIYSAVSSEFPNSNDVGDNDLSNGKRVIIWKNNPKYNDNTLMNDIALLKTGSEFTFNDNRMPVCLPLKTYCAEENTLLLVSGFGTSSSGGPGTILLNQAEVPVRSSDHCNDPSITGYPAAGENIPYEAMFCAGGQTTNKDSCQGDSGGPLVHKRSGDNTATLVGVVSWGFGCNEPIHPGVYATVSSYTFWIAQQTGVRVIDEDYSTPPLFDCFFDHNRGQLRSTVAPTPQPGGSEGSGGNGSGGGAGGYVNQLFENDEAMKAAGFKTYPFKKGTLRMQGRCLDWNRLDTKLYANFQSKNAKKCKIYSKYNSDYEEDSYRSYIKYDTNDMTIKICPPGHKESDDQYCLATHPTKLRVGGKRTTKGNKKMDVIYIKECDENDNKQKFLVKRKGSKIVMAFDQNQCVARTTYAGKQVMYLTNRKFRCKSAT